MHASPMPHRRGRSEQSLLETPAAQSPNSGPLKVRHGRARGSASRGAPAKRSAHDAQRVPRVSGIHQPVGAVSRHKANRQRRRRGDTLKLRCPGSGPDPLNPAEQTPALVPHGGSSSTRHGTGQRAAAAATSRSGRTCSPQRRHECPASSGWMSCKPDKARTSLWQPVASCAVQRHDPLTIRRQRRHCAGHAMEPRPVWSCRGPAKIANWCTAECSAAASRGRTRRVSASGSPRRLGTRRPTQRTR